MPFWPFRRTKPEAPTSPPEPKQHWLDAMGGDYSTHKTGPKGYGPLLLEAVLTDVQAALPRIAATPGTAMDDNSNGMPEFKLRRASPELPDELTGWFVSQGFIGYQTCALIAQNWLVDKALTMPARDAIRHGYDIHLSGVPEGPEGEGPDRREAEIIEEIRRLDKKYRVRHELEQFVKMGRLFGVRVLLFRIEGINYEEPFNIDGVQPGAYKGMSQVDPYWCIPELDVEAVTNPAGPHFYDPTWWVIDGKRYHRSHLCIFRASDVPDMLKPQYMFGGIPVPQRIVERVYAAERTANEGPQLAMTKRLTVWNTDLAALYANQEKAAEHMAIFTQYRDNHGVKLVDASDTMAQFETSLADLDTTIMTQYQLVAAASGVPATKLLGTTPKGFNATGEYDESSYHEELETIQANDLTPLLDRHYELLMRSVVEPNEGFERGALTVNLDWTPVDSPTAQEYATINKTNAETDNILVLAGAIDGMDVRRRIQLDPNSGYTGLEEPEADEGVEALIAEALNGAETTPVDAEAQGLGGEPGRRDVQGPRANAPGAARAPLPGASRPAG